MWIRVGGGRGSGDVDNIYYFFDISIKSTNVDKGGG